MNDKTDVLIVGAGPTGLTLAVDLARRGVACRVVDQASEPSGGSKGKGLQPRTLEVFDDLGVAGPILAAATPYPPVRVRVGRVPIWQARMHKPVAATYPLVMMHPQWRTEAVLRERLAELGGKVERGSALTGFEQDAGGVSTRLGMRETVRARYLVAADGGRSTVRKALGVGFGGETREEERMVLGDVRVEGVGREHIHVWVRPGKGMAALYPMAGTDTFQFLASLKPGVAPDLTLAGFRRASRNGRCCAGCGGAAGDVRGGAAAGRGPGARAQLGPARQEVLQTGRGDLPVDAQLSGWLAGSAGR